MTMLTRDNMPLTCISHCELSSSEYHDTSELHNFLHDANTHKSFCFRTNYSQCLNWDHSHVTRLLQMFLCTSNNSRDVWRTADSVEVYLQAYSTQCIFTARAYASAVVGVVILSVRPSVRLSVTRVDCDKTKWRTTDIFIPHESAITLLFWYQPWLVGDAPFPLKSAFKVTHPPSKHADFDRFPLITSQP